jgi:Regulator of Chromosome Condensation (RCC1) repeat protein/Calx-beta domain-containing protein/Big-like domain-containing protein
MKTFRLPSGCFLLVALTALVSSAVASPIIILPAGSVWRYRADGTDLGTLWREVSYDDSIWNSGPAQLGFGDGDEATMLTPGIMTAYFRRPFDSPINGVTSLTLRLLRDDGAVVYINGMEVFRSNMPPGPVVYDTPATVSVGGAEESTQFVTAQINPNVLVQGLNVVAVEVHQVTQNSGDLSFDLALIAEAGPEQPVVTVTAIDAEAAELSPLVDAAPNPGVFRITRSGPTNEALRVSYGLGGTASNGADYMNLSGVAEIAAGATTADVVVHVLYDVVAEGDETVVLRLLPLMCGTNAPPPPGCYRVGLPDSATVTIHDSIAPNLPPTVRLASPTNSAVFAGPTNIFINAIANDPNGFLTIKTVEFFEGARSLGIRTNYPTLTPGNPFMLIWQDVPLGQYTLTAVATDDHAATGTSAPVHISVISQPVLPPLVNVVATDSDAAESGAFTAIFPGTFTFYRSGPTSNALTAFFTLSGSAENGVDYTRLTNEVRFNPGQAQSRVDVYPLNDNLVEGTENVLLTLQELGCIAIVPPPPGCYRVGPSNRAEVLIRDANTPPNQRPYVQLNEPQNGDVFKAPTNIVLRAFAHDQEDGYQLTVEFFDGTNRLGQGEFVPTTCPAPYCPFYQLVWINPPPGDHTLFARATDSGGASSNSAPVTITVQPRDAGTNVTLVANGSVWKYLDNGTDQGTAWRQLNFNDSTWSAGPAQLGYGDGDEATVVGFGPDPLNKYITTYFRRSFNVVNAASFSELRGTLLEDDGAVLYLNGVEVFRSNLPFGLIAYNTSASAAAENQLVPFAASGNFLREGLNVVAVEMHQVNGASTDLSFDLELIGIGAPQPPTNEPPHVVITSPSDGAIFIAPPEISIEALTMDPDGYATTVEFFANDQKIGESTIVFIREPDPGQPIHFQFTWSNPPIGQHRLTARTVDNGGARSESEPVNITVRENPPVGAARDDQEYPAVASDGVNFFAVWMDRRNHNYTEGGSDYDIYGARVSPSGEVLDRMGIPICTAPRMQFYPSVAFDGQNYLVVWGDNRDNVNGILSNEIYGARVTPGGEVLDSNGFKITHGEVAYQPVVAFNGTEYLVAAYAYDHNGVRGSTVLGVRVRPTGEVRDNEELILHEDSFGPVTVASIGSEWLVVWSSSGSVQGVRVSAAGAVSNPITLLENHHTWSRGLAAAGPNYFLTSVGSRQVASDTYVLDVFGTWISREGQPFRTVMISSNRNQSVGSGSGQPTTYVQDHPTAAAQGTNIVVVWETGSIYTNGGTYYSGSDLRGARVLITGFVSPSFPICTAPQQQTFPSIAFNGQQFLTAWQDARTAPPDEYLPLRQFDIFGARIAPSGSVLDPNGFLISTAVSNRPPHVQINAPRTGDVFTAPADITLNAYAQDPEDSYYVTVEFFANDRSLGVGTFVPTRCATPYCPYFELTWSNVPPGEYTLQARATDRAGGSAYSEPVSVTVREQTTGDRELHVVGVYSGTVNGGVSHNNEEGRTAVVVDRPGKLVTLFLSAYEPVRWSITASTGTTIEKIYVSGYYTPVVESVGSDTQVIVLPYGYYIGYTLDSGQFYRTAPKVRQLTGLEIASFHGNYQGPYPTPFVIDAVQDDPRLHSTYPVPTPLSELPDVRFSISFYSGSGISSRAYTLAGPTDGGDLLPNYDRVVADNHGKYYIIGDGGVEQIDGATGVVRLLPMDPNLPEVSWPMGLAYDSLRDRVLLVTLGGEGFLYGYSPTQDRWSVVSSMNNLDLASLVYHAAEDALYGLGVSSSDYGDLRLYRLSADGHGTTAIPLPLYPWGVHMNSSELVSVGEYLVLLLRPSIISYPYGGNEESRMYLIDPRTGESWLTYRSSLPHPRDSDSDGVPDDLDQCPGTPPNAVVDAYGCSADQRDSDHDGVPDSRDQCPDTPSGTVVDANGCPVPQSRPQIVGWGCNFAGETQAPAGLSNVIALAGGQYHTLALKRDGTVVAWGRNDFGQNDVPAEATGIVAIASLRFHDLAVTRDGRVIAWGYNHSGQTDVPAGLSNVIAVAVGFSHSLALKADGTVVGWGNDDHGQSTSPADLANVRAISAGATHSLALKTDGTLVAWGDNTYGQTDLPDGLKDVVAIASGIYQSYALKRDGTVVGWGWNVAVLEGLSNAVAIAAGGDHLVALRRDRTVVSGGYYECDDQIPQPELRNVIAVAAGGDHSLALVGSPPNVGDCPCDAPWRNNAEYVACVIRQAWELFRAGLITADQRGEMIRDAIMSSCGRQPDSLEPVCIHLYPLTHEECGRDGVQFVLSGDATGSCILECSTDLVNWTPVPNTSTAIDGCEIRCQIDSTVKARFYRLRMQ